MGGIAGITRVTTVLIQRLGLSRFLMPTGAPGRCGRPVACQPWDSPRRPVITAIAAASGDV